jgi:hypothetical protein
VEGQYCWLLAGRAPNTPCWVGPDAVHPSLTRYHPAFYLPFHPALSIVRG